MRRTAGDKSTCSPPSDLSEALRALSIFCSLIVLLCDNTAPPEFLLRPVAVVARGLNSSASSSPEPSSSCCSEYRSNDAGGPIAAPAVIVASGCPA